MMDCWEVVGGSMRGSSASSSLVLSGRGAMALEEVGSGRGGEEGKGMGRGEESSFSVDDALHHQSIVPLPSSNSVLTSRRHPTLHIFLALLLTLDPSRIPQCPSQLPLNPFSPLSSLFFETPLYLLQKLLDLLTLFDLR